MRTENYVETYLAGIGEIAAVLDRRAVVRALDLLFRAWQKGATVFTAGNGGSASTASHLAADLAKCTVAPGRPRLRALSLVDNVTLLTALVNDDGWEKVYVRQLESLFRPGDVLVAVSVHGGAGRGRAGAWSQNLLRAVDYVRANRGSVLGLAGFDGGALARRADVAVVVPFRTTPHVESFHAVLHHLLAFGLAERIRATPEVARAARRAR